MNRNTKNTQSLHEELKNQDDDQSDRITRFPGGDDYSNAELLGPNSRFDGASPHIDLEQNKTEHEEFMNELENEYDSTKMVMVKIPSTSKELFSHDYSTNRVRPVTNQGDTPYFQQNGPAEDKTAGGSNEQQLEWWPMKIGKLKDELNDILSYVKPNEYDVYPLSIYYERGAQLKMKFYRIFALLVCIYIISPLSIYYSETSLRIGFYANKLTNIVVPVHSILDGTFTVMLSNCDVQWYTNTQSGDSIRFEMGYDFNTNMTSDGASFIIIDQPAASKIQCIVNVYFPGKIRLPNIVFVMNGTVENVLFEDKFMEWETVLNFTSLSVVGQTAFITLHNHFIDDLYINLHYSLTNIYSIYTHSKEVFIYSGYYNEHVSVNQSSIFVTATQNEGLICMVAPIVQTLNMDIDCLANYTSTDNLDINGVRNISCGQQVYMCTNPQNCNLAYPESVYNISVTDGPIQVRFNPNLAYQINDQFVNSQVMFANKYSTNVLNDTTNLYTTDTANDRIFILQTVGIDYGMTWLYTNKLPYLEALVWPLSWASLTLLRPSMAYNKIVIIDSQCPARGTIDQVNYDLNTFYYYSLPQQVQTGTALVTGFSKFSYVAKDKFGKVVQIPVSFTDDSLLVVAFGLSAGISLLGAGFICSILYQVFKVGRKSYSAYIETQRHLAYTRQQDFLIQTKGQANIETLTYEQNQIIESRGLFSARFEKSAFKSNNQKKSLQQINFSMFQVPAIYIDFLFRKRANSFNAFLNAIDESKYHFTTQKMKSHKKDDVSIPVEELEKEYSNFCARCGYKQLNIKDQEKTLEYFQLELDYQNEKQKPAYVYIRFKSVKEKEQQAQGMVEDTGKSQAQSLISLFLGDECAPSSFKDDYIFLEVLQSAYLKYCDVKNKPESDRQQIINSDEIKSFGATISMVTPPPIIIGLKRGKLENSIRKSSSKVNMGLVRKPINMKSASFSRKVSRFFKSQFSDLFEPEKPLANFAIVILHFIIIIIFPILYAAIAFFALSEITRIQGDVFATPVTFWDVIYTNSLDPFYYKVPYFRYFCYAMVYLGFYVVFAFLELLSFYLTNYDNQGKFPVKYSPVKKIITTIYQISLLILLFVIMCQFMMVCVWAILGAIMNPQKFLPYATASITFFGTVLAKFAYYQMKYQMILRRVQGVIAELMDQLVGESILKLQQMIDASLGPPKSKSLKAKMNYNSDIRGFFKIDETEKSTSSTKITDVKELSKVASARLGGLQPIIIEACLAVQANNKFNLYNSLANLSAEFNMDKELIENITELSLSDYNPDQFGIREPSGLVVVSIKRLFRRLFSQLDVELFGDLIQIVTEGDTTPLLNLLKDFDFDYKNLFEAMIYSLFADEKPKMLPKRLLKFVQDIALQNKNEDIYDKFKILYKLQDGQIDSILENLNDIIAYREQMKSACNTTEERAEYKKNNPMPIGIANTIGFQYNFPLMCMIALQKSNSSLSRNTINQTFKEIIVEQNLLEVINVKYDQKLGEQARFNTQANQLYQCFYLIIKGRDIDFKRITASEETVEVNIDNLEELHQVSMNNVSSFEFILNVMQCAQKKDILLEFYTLMQKTPFKAIQLCDTFAIQPDKGKTLSLLMLLLYRVLKFEAMLSKFLPNSKSKLKGRDRVTFSIHIQKMVDTVLLLEERESMFTSDIKSKLSQYMPKDEVEEEDAKDDVQSVNNEDGGASSHGEGSKGEGSQKSEEEKLEEEATAKGEIDEVAMENNKKVQHKKDIKKIVKRILMPTKQIDIKGRKGYKALWDLVFESQKIQDILSDEASQILRCYAVVMLKTEGQIQASDKEYIKCFRILAQFFDIQNEKLELLIDLITGNPLDVFKLYSKNLGFDPATLTFFNAKFDQTRLNLLSILLQSNITSLQKVCAYWYQEYLIINQAYMTLPILLRNFKIRAEFIKILAEYQMSQSESHTSFNQYEYIQLIISYLKGGLKQSKKNLIKKADNLNINQDEPLYTDTLFLTQDQYDKEIKEEEKKEQQAKRKKEEYTPRRLEVVQVYNDFQIDMNTLTRMEELLMIKSGNKKILSKFFNKLNTGDSNNYTKIMSAILQVSSFSTPNTILDFLQTVSCKIPLFDEFTGEDTKSFSARNQNLFVQLNLILNSFSFQNNCRNSNINDSFMNNSISKMIKLANDSNKEAGFDEIIYAEESNFNYIIKNLYEQDYFKDIAVQLFGKLGDFSPKQCNFILGLFLGGTLQNAALLRQSMVSLLVGHSVNLTFVKGISGVLMGDLNASNDIKVLARQLELDGQLIINILDLTNKRTEQLPQIIYDLFSKDQSDQVLTLTSLIYAIKKDVTNVKPIANKLGVDANLLIPVLAAAVGKTSILSNFYQTLATKFHIQNHNSVRYSVEISKGQTGCISELQNKKSKLFYIPEPELFEAIIYLLDSGSQIYGQKNAANSLALKLDGSLAHLFKKLKKAFTFDTMDKEKLPKGTSKKLNEAIHLLFNACWGDYQSIQILYKRLRGKEVVEQTEQNENAQKPPIKSIWIKQNPHLHLFQDDPAFINHYHIFQKIRKATTQKLMRNKFQQIADDFDLIQSQIKELQQNMIDVLKKDILPEINKRYQNKEFKAPLVSDKLVKAIADNSPSKIGGNNSLKDNLQKGMLNQVIGVDQYIKLSQDIEGFARSRDGKQQLKKDFKGVQLYEVAFKTGCTFGITLFKKLRQPFFYCIQCNGEAEDDSLGICIMCALICHNGHKLKPGNYGMLTKIICDCGSGKFNGCNSFLSNNPIEKIVEDPINKQIEVLTTGKQIEAPAKEKQIEVKSCAALRKHFRKVQEDLWASNKEEKDTKSNAKDNKPDNLIKTEQQKIDEMLLYYTNEMFFTDLARAIDLPDYFANKTILQEVFNGEEFKDTSTSMFDDRNDLIGLKDELIGRNISLIENLVLLSSGRSTDSFVTLLTSKNQYKYDHYQNQLIYSKASKKGKLSKTLGTYNALSCFIAMVQGDNQRFQRYGQGYVDALGESGTKEVTAKDKICNILRISNGGKLPLYQAQTKTDKANKQPKIKANGYLTTFQKLFGVHGVKVIALHKLLTLKKGDLIKISSSSEEQDFKDHPELKNVQDWINNNLYENYLSLESKNVEWIKTIIRLCCQDIDAFNFIVQEKKIPPLKASMYKALLTGNKYDLQPIFDKLKTFIPYGLNKFMNQIWSFDRKAIIDFIFRFAEVDSMIQKTWKDMDFKQEVEGVEDYKHKKNYLFNLFSLMSGETLFLGEKMASLICHLSNKNIEFKKSFYDMRTGRTILYTDCNMSDFQSLFRPDNFVDRNPDVYRLIYSLISIHGIFTDNVLEIPQIARYFDEKKSIIKEGEALSLVSLCNKCWNQNDVEFILRKLMGSTNDKQEIPTAFYQLAKQILQSSEGELESIGKISDEVFATDNCHIRSLLVSCITGNTKFDYLDDLPEKHRQTIDIQGRRNLLKREMYYIYEKVARFALRNLMKDTEQSNAFLDYSFTQKIPLHLFSILSENFNMVSKLFDPTSEFCDNLNKKLKKNTPLAQQQYLSIFLDFLDPFTLTSNIKPILRKVLEIEGDAKMFINVKKLDAGLKAFSKFKDVKFEKVKVDNDANLIKNLYDELHVEIKADSIQIEMIALIELVMQCFQGDKKAFISLNNVFFKLFENVPVLAHLFNLISKLLQGKKNQIFDNLPAVVAIIIMLYKKQLLGDQGIDDKDKKLIESVVSWMETIMIMLDKENNFDSEAVRKKLQTMVIATLEYYGDSEDHCFKDNKQNVVFIVDVIQGIMNLAKGNFSEMERMSMKIGGFPPVEKLIEFFKITGKHNEMLDFGVAQVTEKKEEKDDDPEQKTFDAKGLFEYFSKSNNGYIGIEEFRNVCKNLGVKGGSRQLMIFAKVDTKHTGNLNFYQFSKAITQIQLLVVEETIEQMGLSINDLVLEFVWAIVILLMLFIFIFIGIMAFAPVTSFSSVLNSSLLAGSGGFVNGKKDENEDNNASEDATSSAAGDIIGGSS